MLLLHTISIILENNRPPVAVAGSIRSWSSQVWSTTLDGSREQLRPRHCSTAGAKSGSPPISSLSAGLTPWLSANTTPFWGSRLNQLEIAEESGFQLLLEEEGHHQGPPSGVDGQDGHFLTVRAGGQGSLGVRCESWQRRCRGTWVGFLARVPAPTHSQTTCSDYSRSAESRGFLYPQTFFCTLYMLNLVECE